MLRRLYAALLLLYPREFRAEFGAEMLDVFDQAAAGSSRAWLLLLRELFDLPAGLLAAWMRALTARRAAAFTPARIPWRQSIPAALPFVLLGLLAGLPDLLRQTGWNGPGPLLWLTVIAAALVSLAWAAVRRWPRWTASWTLLWPGLFLAMLVALSNGRPSFRAFEPIFRLFIVCVMPLVLAWLLYQVARSDRIAALVAALPLMQLVWIPFFEETPLTQIPDPLSGSAYLFLFLIAGAAAVGALRANRLGPALVMVLSAGALGGLPAVYAGTYFGGMLPAVEPRPTLRALVALFLPALAWCSLIALGPLLARSLRERGLRCAGPYRLALAGLLILLIVAVMWAGRPLSSPDFNYPREWGRALGWGTAGLGLGLYLLGALLLVRAEQRAGLREPLSRRLLLFGLPLGVPLLLLAPTPYGAALAGTLLEALLTLASLAWVIAAACWVALEARSPRIEASA